MSSVPLQPQWTPAADDVANARITAFTRFVAEATGREFDDYDALWRWSVDEIDSFWGLLWSFLGLGEVSTTVLSDATMPGAQWFPDAQLNYVDRIAHLRDSDRIAIRGLGEDGSSGELTFAEVVAATAAFASTLRTLGVQAGDRVVGYLPDIPEAVIAFLATASIGAIWSACGQDYTANAALDRLGQLNPVVLVTADGYSYGGKVHDKTVDITALRAGLPALRAAVLVPRRGSDPDASWMSWDDAVRAPGAALVPTPVPFDHPLWVLFSSGTTGKPKGIMHGHGGVVLEHLKVIALQSDIDAGDTLFWFTSPSWMMWNYRNSALLTGATIVCYDGNPSYPRPDSLWELAASTATTVLGTSPGYVLNCIKADANPRRDFDLGHLRTVGITGSPLPATSSQWLADEVCAHVSSISGGTDVVSAFCGGVATVPVWPGELSAPYLGTRVEAWNEAGEPVVDGMGELVITKPMPSMPVGFWNDPDGSRYRSAYFEHFPGVWRHGDWITITERGSIVVHGRSDATLNRGGVRMGVADIYQVVEQIPQVLDALVIGVEKPDGGYWMPLFVVLAEGHTLTDELTQVISAEIRTKLSPRHVPDDVIAAPGIPHTRTGKRLEVPIKRILQGADPEKVVARSAIDQPELLSWYADLSR